MTEHTSKRVAKIAGRILAIKQHPRHPKHVTFWAHETKSAPNVCGNQIAWKDIRALAASCLNQAQDHAERDTLRAGKLPKGHRLIKRHKPVKRRLNHD